MAILVLLILATVSVYAWTAWRFFNYMQDDAFINLRYAINFHLGNGWVLTKGDPVEGYTSPAQLWIITAVTKFFDIDRGIFALKFIGFILGGATLLMTSRLTTVIYPGHPRIAALTPLLVVLHPGFTISMINTMEQSLAACLLTWGLLRLLEEDSSKKSVDYGTPVIFAALALTRPEFVILYPALLLLCRRTRGGVLSGIPYAAVLAVFEAARIYYYHDYVPNTYHAKWNPAGGIVDGWIYLVDYGAPWQASVGLLIILVGLVAMRRQTSKAIPLIVALVLHSAFVVASGGDWMLEGRFVTPILPEVSIACIAACVAAFTLIDRMLTPRGKPMKPAGLGDRALAVAVVCALAYFATQPCWDKMSSIVNPRTLSETLAPGSPLSRWSCVLPDGRIKMANWVSSHARPGQLVVTSELGLVSVMNPLINFIDFRGLADRRIAAMHSYQHCKYGVFVTDWMDPSGEAANYLLSRRPDFIIILDDGDQEHPGCPAARSYQSADSFIVVLDHTEESPYVVNTWIRR